MSALVVNEFMEFNSLKSLLGVTDGNLASHLKALEKEQFILVQKSFIGRKPNTKYIVTEIGQKLFAQHISALEDLIKNQKPT